MQGVWLCREVGRREEACDGRAIAVEGKDNQPIGFVFCVEGGALIGWCLSGCEQR